MNVKSLKLADSSDRVSSIKVTGHEADVKAVYALLGGYNEVARRIDVEEFYKLQTEFKRIVGEVSDKLLLG